MDLNYILENLRQARLPEDVFGVPSGPSDTWDASLKSTYRRLQQACHPDLNANADEAQEATKLLNAFWERTVIALKSNTYGQRRAVATVSTSAHTWECYESSLRGDICDFFDCESGSLRGILKLARHPRDNELLRNEATILRSFADDADQTFHDYLPQLVEPILYRSSGRERQGNVFRMPTELYTMKMYTMKMYSLAEVMEVYPKGLDPRDMAWIWRRLLLVLGYAHHRGVIHGAVIPEHVLIEPNEHLVVLVDWCYALRSEPARSEPARFGTLKLIPMKYKDWYPPEVLAKRPVDATVDMYTGAATMLALMGADPLSDSVPGRIGAFMQSARLPKPVHRLDNAWKLLESFDELIAMLWGKRKYRALDMKGR